MSESLDAGAESTGAGVVVVGLGTTSRTAEAPSDTVSEAAGVTRRVSRFGCGWSGVAGRSSRGDSSTAAASSLGTASDGGGAIGAGSGAGAGAGSGAGSESRATGVGGTAGGGRGGGVAG